MDIQRWNYDKKAYEPYVLRRDADVAFYAGQDMSVKRDCANCLQPHEVGDMYTSMELHTKAGFGYMVCPSCHDKEWEYRKAKEGERNA